MSEKPQINENPTNDPTPKQPKPVEIAALVRNIRDGWNAADVGSGPERKGKGDGFLNRIELAQAFSNMQGGKFSPVQIEALEKMGAEGKIKISDLVDPYEKAFAKIDKNRDGYIQPTELPAAYQAAGKAADKSPAR